MEGDTKEVLKGRKDTPFKKKGSNKKGKRGNLRSEHSENAQVPNPTDTVYRILCPSKKIGGVIGKGGGIIKVLREETKAKITVSGSIRGSDERVVLIYSPPEKSTESESGEGDVVSMPAHCPAQEALMRVHDRIIEEDLSGRKGDDGDEECTLTARLLVPNNMVGCLLGKGGDVIQRLRTETGASIRVLPAEHLPPCALQTDELVQMQGKPAILKRALYEVSTLLHQNPRKDKALHFALSSRGPTFHGAGSVTNMPPHRGVDPMWPPRDPSRRMPPPPWMEDYPHHTRFNPGAFDDDLSRPGVEHSGEFSMKLLCSNSKIGGVIGKGGINVRQLQQETGTNIHVEEASTQSEERVIRVSAYETLRNKRSQTIDAILFLQNKVSDISEKGEITTRLLVPSNKVGCLLGQGGTIINTMRRRTQADIRVYSKDEKPECASEDEELVQISGSIATAKDAMGEIASRLRVRCLKDGGGVAEPASVPPPPRSGQGYGPTGVYSQGGPPVPGPSGMGYSGGYNVVKGGMPEYEPPSYPVQPSASRYPNPNSSIEGHYPNSSMGSAPGTGGSFYAHMSEAPGMRKHHDPYLGGSDSMVDIRGGSDNYPAPSVTYNNYSDPNNPHQSSYPDTKGQGSYHTLPPQQSAYQNHHQIPYPQQNNAQQNPYGNMNSHHGAYQSVAAQGSYQY